MISKASAENCVQHRNRGCHDAVNSVQCEVQTARTANSCGDGVGEGRCVKTNAHGSHGHVGIGEPAGDQDEALVQPPLQAACAHTRQRQLQVRPPTMQALCCPAPVQSR